MASPQQQKLICCVNLELSRLKMAAGDAVTALCRAVQRRHYVSLTENELEAVRWKPVRGKPPLVCARSLLALLKAQLSGFVRSMFLFSQVCDALTAEKGAPREGRHASVGLEKFGLKFWP